MCEPTTLAYIAIAMTAAGGISQAQTSRATGKFNAQVARNNKIISDRRAEDALARGVEAEATQRRKTEAVKGAQKVAFGAGGIQLGTGTAADVLAGTATIGELDALTIRNNARREAYGFRLQGEQELAAGELAEFEGRSRAGATLLTTAGSVAGKWYDLKKAG